LASPDSAGTLEGRRQCHGREDLKGQVEEPARQILRRLYQKNYANVRIGAMNMLLHGVENPDVSYRDSLSEDSASEENKYTLVLANPPFAGSLDYESTSGKLQRVVKTKKTELLFMALFLQLLKPGGRAAVIVPMVCCSDRPTLTKNCAAPWWKTISSKVWCRYRAACSAPMPV
jgi:hypothetical protein